MLDYSEIEYKILDQLAIHYVYFPQQSDGQKAILARYVMNLDEELLLIPSYYAFSYSGIIAGLTEKQVEYLAKNAPKDYKIELTKSILNEYKMKDVLKIAKMMDDDMGNGVIQNQKRIENMHQYVLDNLVVFKF